MTQNIKYMLLATLLLTASMISCEDPGLDAPVVISIIEVDSSGTSKENDNNAALKLRPSNDPLIVVELTNMTEKSIVLLQPEPYDFDDSKIKNDFNKENKSTELSYYAFGGSATAGVINGGYNNESIQTAYPNLIANQLRLKNFKQPTFPTEEFNGFGKREVIDQNFTNGPFKKFAEASNNLSELQTSKFNRELNNLGIPFIGRRGLGYNYSTIELLKKDYPENIEYQYNGLFLSPEKYSLVYRLRAEKAVPDIFTISIDWDDLMLVAFDSKTYISAGASYALGSTDVYSITSSSEMRLVHELTSKIESESSKNSKGFIATIPNLLEFPIMKLKSWRNSQKELQGITYFFYRSDIGDRSIENVYQNDLFSPTSAVDSLFGQNVSLNLKKGLSGAYPLSHKDVINDYERGVINLSIEQLNTHYGDLSKKYGVHIVDLNKLFSQIMKGEYATWDGVKVDPSYPNGNFFNADGLSLTPFGQSIVANAFLEKMNEVFESKIPLIKTSYYLNLDSRKE